MFSPLNTSPLGKYVSTYLSASLAAGAEVDAISSHMLSSHNANLFLTSADFSGSNDQDDKVRKKRAPIDTNTFLRVRQSVCVVGMDRNTVRDIKTQIGRLTDEPFPLEGFHVKQPSDIKDGALLVPKLILVAKHCPGRKLIDNDADEGQLDLLYDEAVEMGADVMLIYTDLPRSIYKPMRHAIYHPKLGEMLFGTQPTLKELASENCLLTLNENSRLNSMQENVIREWLEKPVGTEHPVYRTADYLSSVELSMSEAETGGATLRRMQYYIPNTYHGGEEANGGADDIDGDFVPATEEHPLADKKKKKKRKEKKDKKDKERKSKSRHAKPELGTLVEVLDDGGESHEVELKNMRQTEQLVFENTSYTFDQFV